MLKYSTLELLMPITPFAKNRAAFPIDELAKFVGKWVAFTPDGTKIVAAHEDVLLLDQLVRDAGFDPRTVVFEGVPEEDTMYGGGLI
jgi:hypothetical protein